MIDKWLKAGVLENGLLHLGIDRRRIDIVGSRRVGLAFAVSEARKGSLALEAGQLERLRNFRPAYEGWATPRLSRLG